MEKKMIKYIDCLFFLDKQYRQYIHYFKISSNHGQRLHTPGTVTNYKA
jgi:hypothetical protein